MENNLVAQQTNNLNIYKAKGIYAILNIKTGEAYIGQTVGSFGDRRDVHFVMLRNGKHHNINLQKSWDIYGEQCFKLVILEEMSETQFIDDREKFWISEYSKKGKSFNILAGGKGACGMVWSDETKRRIGEKNRLHNLCKKMDEETKKKISEANKGKVVSKETREKLSVALKGRKMRQESKLLSSISHSGENSVLHKYTKEQIIKVRELYDKGITSYETISNETGVSKRSIYGIVYRKRWKYI